MEHDHKASNPSPTSTLATQCYLECEAMAKYALASGKKVSGSLLQQLKGLQPSPSYQDVDGRQIHRLAECHGRLSKLIAPATPRTILLLDSETEQSGLLRFLGPVPLIRQMMVTALLSLIALVCLTLSPEVNGSRDNSDILVGSGMPLLLNELFLISAAALGASFSALFMANRYIQEGTFDPKFNISYWIRFVLGIIAGFILATLIDFEAIEKAGGGNGEASSAFARPLLAMIGGFSAAVVYRILNRLAETVESLFRGDMREQFKASAETERNRLENEAQQGRTQLAYKLMNLQNQLGSDASADTVQKQIDSLLRELVGDDVADATSANRDQA